jgi:hypothetical protein
MSKIGMKVSRVGDVKNVSDTNLSFSTDFDFLKINNSGLWSQEEHFSSYTGNQKIYKLCDHNLGYIPAFSIMHIYDKTWDYSTDAGFSIEMDYVYNEQWNYYPYTEGVDTIDEPIFYVTDKSLYAYLNPNYKNAIFKYYFFVYQLDLNTNIRYKQMLKGTSSIKKISDIGIKVSKPSKNVISSKKDSLFLDTNNKNMFVHMVDSVLTPGSGVPFEAAIYYITHDLGYPSMFLSFGRDQNYLDRLYIYPSFYIKNNSNQVIVSVYRDDTAIQGELDKFYTVILKDDL